MFFRCFLAFLCFGAFSSSSFAADREGIYFSEGLLAYTLGFNQNNSALTSRSEIASQTGLGYVFSGWFYLGAIFNYTYLSETTADSSGANTNHLQTFEYYGASVGYLGQNWLFMAHYLAYTEFKDNVSDPTGGYINDRNGSGYGIDIGYRFQLSGFELGPLISAKSITYQNCRDPNSGVTSSCNPNITQLDLTPYMQVMVNFK